MGHDEGGPEGGHAGRDERKRSLRHRIGFGASEHRHHATLPELHGGPFLKGDLPKLVA